MQIYRHHPPIPEAGLIRLAAVLASVRPTAWWAKVKADELSRQAKLSPRSTCWRVEDIRELIRRDHDLKQ